MQNQHVGYRIKGFYSLYNYAIKYGMENDTANYRNQVLNFWHKHGTTATLDAFNIGRRTLYNWQKKYDSGGIAALAPLSKAPKKRRCRRWNRQIVNKIRALRNKYPNLGKDKVHVLLIMFCQTENLKCPSVSTVGRIIADAPDKMRSVPQRLSPKGKMKPYKRQQVTRKPKGFKAGYPGECVGLDTIERRMWSLKRYVMTFIDPKTSFAFAVGVDKNNSTNAARLFTSAQSCYPFPIKTALSDNGPEFKGAFDNMLKEAQIEHWHTYPSTPKMNAHCERFNRTIQEEFIDYHENLLFTDLQKFNEKLADWLVWYNKNRPHYAQGQTSPIQAMIEYQPKCNMYWTHTKD